MMLQYQQIKAEYRDCLLLFRLGDFYELFLDDAEVGAQILGITLTARPRGKDGDIPMAGVPFHAAENYINKLLKAGHKVALCEQVSDANQKGLTERAVVKVLTPGTQIDQAALESTRHNILASLVGVDDHLGLVLIEVSTGSVWFQTYPKSDRHQVEAHLQQFAPIESVVQEPIASTWEPILNRDWLITNRAFQVSSFKLDTIWEDNQLPSELKQVKNLARLALIQGLKYIQDSHFQLPTHLQPPKKISEQASVWLDPATSANLELFSSTSSNRPEAHLYGFLNQTHTPMGARLLRLWLQQPLRRISAINLRQQVVSFLLKEVELADDLSANLSRLGDVERLNSKIHLGQANPKEVLQYAQLIDQLIQVSKPINQVLEQTKYSLIQPISTKAISGLSQKVKTRIKDDAPGNFHTRSYIQTGWHEAYDQLYQQIRQYKQKIADYQEKQRNKTNISSLKISYNKVFGYYIEISKAHTKPIPSDYQRKQTLTNAERYTTEFLQQQEEAILSRQNKLESLERELFDQLINQLRQTSNRVQTAAQTIAHLDCLLTFARLAQEFELSQPHLHSGNELKIVSGKHPVITKLLPQGKFVPNHTQLATQDQPQFLHLITGPNMAGKSVYMRQVGLIVLLAHLGCFVPAKQATIPLVDAIFVRSGAGDIISEGLSTFMVEMTETASILNRATPKSLIILDEIGRGTTTYDGISIAWSVAEFICKQLKAKTLFATHYHELQELPDLCPEQAANYYAMVEKHQDELVFIHRIMPGKAKASYAIDVAARAKMPDAVLTQARNKLKQLETKSQTHQSESKTVNQQKNLLLSDIETQIKQLDVAKTTPLEALNKLAQLQELINTAASKPNN